MHAVLVFWVLDQEFFKMDHCHIRKFPAEMVIDLSYHSDLVFGKIIEFKVDDLVFLAEFCSAGQESSEV